ncbi:MAG TPA: glycoside hydrolase family 2 TIM barrel-domain containing protein [Anaerolineales bacterium]|nr:glycoside hydrolase family 2 TIM barrel-domain containing protein [Anaerolineales bacterium]
MTFTASARLELDLSGAWQIAFDPEEIAEVQGWTKGYWPEARSDSIHVPEIWNIAFPDAEGIGFYRKVFDLPVDWDGKAIKLHFDGVSYRAEVWLNGRFVGVHMGAYTPFSLDVTSFVHTDSSNELIVRVAALSRTKDVDGMVLKFLPASKQGWYYVFGGIWGKVVLEALPLVACEAVRIFPDLYREIAEAEVNINNQRPNMCRGRLRLQIIAPDGAMVSDQSTEVCLYPGLNDFAYRINVPQPYPWDCEHPYLYQMITEVEIDSLADRTSTMFGMRDFTVQDGQFLLNGSPIYIQGVLLQPHYPINLVTPPDPEMMIREITLVKEAGFNLLRSHLRPAPPGYLQLADRLGILVYEETSLGWIKDNPRLLEQGRREIKELITRDCNHPSVVFWGVFNENPAAAALNSDALVRFTRSLDPTRVVVDNSGGTMAIDQDFGWQDRATMVPNRKTEREEIQDLHLYLGGLVPEPVYAWERALGKNNLSQSLIDHGFGISKTLLDIFDRQIESYRGKIFVSELGCAGMSDLEDTIAQYKDQEHLVDAREMKAFRDSLHNGFAERHLDRIFGTMKDLVREAQELHATGNTRHIEALLANPRISGYILTQLNDVAWEFHAGLLDIWRRPKLAYTAVKRLNQAHVLILNIPKTVMQQDSELALNLTLINRAPLAGPDQIRVQLFDADGKEVYSVQQDAPQGAGINPLGEITLDLALRPGKYQLKARLLNYPHDCAEAFRSFLVLPKVDLEGVCAGAEWIGTPPSRVSSFEVIPSEEDQERVHLIAHPGSLSRTDWKRVLEEVSGGCSALIGPLQPQDEVALGLLASHGITIRLHFGIGSWMGCYHWIPNSLVFSGLPCGGLAGEAYVNVRPRYVISELGGEVLAGSFSNSQTRLEAPAMFWYSDIERITLGKGCLVFCQYLIFDAPSADPLADRLLANLISMLPGREVHD